jgi:hypothetical protein
MVGEAEDWIFEIAEDVDVRSFGRQRHRRGGQRSLPVETGTSETGSGEKVGDGFQRLL